MNGATLKSRGAVPSFLLAATTRSRSTSGSNPQPAFPPRFFHQYNRMHPNQILSSSILMPTLSPTASLNPDRGNRPQASMAPSTSLDLHRLPTTSSTLCSPPSPAPSLERISCRTSGLLPCSAVAALEGFESPVRRPSANVSCQSWCAFGVWVGGTHLGAIRAWLAYEAMGRPEVTGQISDGASFT